MKYFLDTNTCIYFLKGIYPSLLAKMLSVQPSDIKIPAVVKAELIYGVEKSVRRNENMETLAAFLLPFEVAPFADSAAACYAKIRAQLEKLGLPIGPNDLLIAATVIAEQGILVTNNTKEFSRIPELNLENWTA